MQRRSQGDVLGTVLYLKLYFNYEDDHTAFPERVRIEKIYKNYKNRFT